jgi:hypothetical protein
MRRRVKVDFPNIFRSISLLIAEVTTKKARDTTKGQET